MSNTSSKTTAEWNTLNWQKLERAVFKLQKRIYRASQRGDKKAVRKLQKTLLRSWSALCIAVRKVTQDNKGKNTAGVDRIKSLSPEQRLELTQNLKIDHKASSLRRVWIPKSGSSEKRPLGIPTIRDRAKQALAKMALEPEWEAKFETNSYGFRPGRSAHDAIEHIFIGLGGCHKYVLDADISKCFDKINHAELLRKLDTFPTMKRQVKAWLKAGILDGDEFFPTKEGTPQGGVISPLLANIALHGMIDDITSQYQTQKRINGKAVKWKPIIIRYADDFVVLHSNVEVIIEVKEKISHWLKHLDLTLNEEKTKICHSTERYKDNEPGFNFLGFNIKKFKDNRANLGYKTIIQPSEKSIRNHIQNLREILKSHRHSKTSDLIKVLNPVIKGWANYYRTVCSAQTFKQIHHELYMMLKHWGRRRTKSYSRTYQLYWKKIEGKMTFSSDAPKGGKPILLRTHNDVRIVRHVKVRGKNSPYDGNYSYWGERLSKVSGISLRVQKLLKQQKAKCNKCGLHFKSDDKWEVDHVLPKIDGGKDTYNNLQLLHLHCHHSKTGKENQARYANTQCSQVAEEPYEVKVSRTVLD